MKRLYLYVVVFIITAYGGMNATRVADAANLNYGKIVDASQNEALIQYRGIGAQDVYYLCTLDALSCTKADKDTKIIPPTLSEAELLVSRGLTRATSPNSRYQVAFTPATSARSQRTFTITDWKTSKTYTKKSTVTYWDLLSEGLTIFSFSPDSKKLVYLDDISGYPSLYLVDLSKLSGKSFTGTQLITKQYTIADFIFFDNDTIFFTANRESPYNWALYKYSLKNQTVTKIADNTSYSAPLKRAGSNLLFLTIHKDSIDPALYNPKTGVISSFPITPPHKPFPVSGTDEIVTMGGTSGVLMKPTKPAKGNPSLIWLHGGPYRQTSAGYHPYFSYGGYDWILEALRNNGVTILKLDYPGSYGYGRAYAESLKGTIGTSDVQAVLAAADDLKKQTKSSNISLVGNSYGAYLALRTLVASPSHFAGAFSINGVTDWQVLFERIPSSIFTTHFGGVQNEANASLYNQASIFNLLSNIKNQKIVLAHGKKDTDVPFWQSELLNTALENLDKNVDFITYENEGHVYTERKNFVTLCRKLFDFVGVKPQKSCTIN